MSLKRCKIGSKLSSNRNMCTSFRLVPKPMTLNDLWTIFKVSDSLNSAKMAKYSLAKTPTPCRVAGCITSVRPRYSGGIRAPLIYLLTYTVESVRIKPKLKRNLAWMITSSTPTTVPNFIEIDPKESARQTTENKPMWNSVPYLFFPFSCRRLGQNRVHVFIRSVRQTTRMDSPKDMTFGVSLRKIIVNII